jgi:ubiquinone/menaquinone biosynthesis C-methylase UbiE
VRRAAELGDDVLAERRTRVWGDPVPRDAGPVPSRSADSAVKQFYTSYHDRIADKRYHSPYWLRRYVHHQIYAQFLAHLRPGDSMLDAGCGEGVLSCLAARQGCKVVGTDISAPNVRAARALAAEWNLPVSFLQGDSERLAFPDDSFDVVVSSHVLEHLPDPRAGLAELRRVTRDRALIAMPTCLSPAAWALLGGDTYWTVRRRSLVAVPFGVARTALALVRGHEGPNEWYGGHRDAPHIWRFPGVMRRMIRDAGFTIERFEAGPLVLPYAAQYLPFLRLLQPHLDARRAWPMLRNFGYGSLAVCRKRP